MDTETSKKGWWSTRFKIYWPQNENARWYVGLLIAHKIIKPIIHKYQSQLEFWRFHRRADRDEFGHQFNFLFYSPRDTASKIYRQIQEIPLLNKLKNKNILEKTIFDDTKEINHPNIEERSDPNWPLIIRRTWPHFIMGVSQMWLAQIDETYYSNEFKQDKSSLQTLINQYKQINKQISKIWQDQGRHAYLHHLNAIYGYIPLKIIDVSYKQF